MTESKGDDSKGDEIDVSFEPLKDIAAKMSPEEFALALVSVGKLLPRHNIAMRKLFHGSD